ncbi:MAG: hypothetical protein HC819_17940 [Cyclobacteriaceae bacterium]|nr:hypothetical protein [Cyclobacteriaceae bacterium]
MPSMIRLFPFLLLLLFSSCGEEKNDTPIPFALVNQDINLNLVQYQNLRNMGGFVYIPQGDNSGFKGLLVYHEGNGIYRVFDRACAFDPYANCDPLNVDDSGLFIYHDCCQSSYDFHGNPIGGPATSSLRQYDTYVDGIYLIVRNN